MKRMIFIGVALMMGMMLLSSCSKDDEDKGYVLKEYENGYGYDDEPAQPTDAGVNEGD